MGSLTPLAAARPVRRENMSMEANLTLMPGSDLMTGSTSPDGPGVSTVGFATLYGIMVADTWLIMMKMALKELDTRIVTVGCQERIGRLGL